MARKKSSPRTLKKTTGSEAAASVAEVPVGVRLRHARVARRLKLRELAEKAGCSESLLSKVENGRAMPSFGTLHRILGVLGLTMGQLFVKATEPPGVVFRANERPVLSVHPLRTGSGVKFEQLVPSDQGHLLEGSIQTITPGESHSPLITHEGEEVGYVIEGEIELTVGDDTYRLQAGDSYVFRSHLPHGHRNSGQGIARLIVINTPPTF